MADILLLSIDRLLAERIEQAFEQRAKFRLAQQLVRSDLPGAGVIVLDRAAIPQNRSLTSAVADTVAQAEGLPVVLACDATNAAEVLAAIRAGAADVLPREASADEIAVVLGRMLNAAIVGQARRGQLTLVLGRAPSPSRCFRPMSPSAMPMQAGRPFWSTAPSPRAAARPISTSR